MRYTIQVRENEGYAILHQEGEFSKSQMELARDEVVKATLAIGGKGFVVDVRDVPVNFDAFQHFDITTSHEGRIPFQLKVALVANVDPENGRFIENTAFNRGIQLKIFPDEGAAADWVKGVYP